MNQILSKSSLVEMVSSSLNLLNTNGLHLLAVTFLNPSSSDLPILDLAVKIIRARPTTAKTRIVVFIDEFSPITTSSYCYISFKLLKILTSITTSLTTGSATTATSSVLITSSTTGATSCYSSATTDTSSTGVSSSKTAGS